MKAKITTAGLVRAVKKVTKSKEDYHQAHWCGTQRCVAGHAVEGVSKADIEDESAQDKVENALYDWSSAKGPMAVRDARSVLYETLNDPNAKLRVIRKELAEIVRVEKFYDRKLKAKKKKK